MNTKKYNVIGVMSGTSCDGLDLALCSFWFSKNKWHYKLIHSKVIEYDNILKNKLIICSQLNAYDLKTLDLELGKFISKEIKKFIQNNNLKIDLVSSHGHTVFHDTKNRIHHQIGNPFMIYKKIKIPVVFNFREFDVILGGEGAPLVPTGEMKLFNSYDFCINIGGILNISSLKTKKIYGYDVCPANIILNHYSNKLNYDFDNNGELSKKGENIKELFYKLNKIEYYKKAKPKSLDIIYIKKNYFPLFKKIEPENILNTYINHMAYQVNQSIKRKNAKILITGGGALNKHFLEKLNYFNKLDAKYIVPNKKLIIFKEAIVFGFLGLLRFLNEENINKSVTGSDYSTSSGIILDNKMF